MIRHPSENFIKYLMTTSHPQANDNVWVMTMVVSFGYPKPDDEYMVWMRASVMSRTPNNFQPQNRYHRESVKFMRNEGIYSLHNPDRATKEAGLLVTNLRARPIIENLLLGRMDPKDVAKRVNARLGEFFTEEGIKAYAHYYWNVSLLRVEDWAKLYQDYDVQRNQAMAIVQVGPSMALHKMGFQQGLESKTILKEMLEGVYFDFREWKTKPMSESRTRAITGLAKAAVMLDLQLSQADSALKDSLRAFEQFRMQHSQMQVPDVRSVAPAGNYTGSGARLLEAPVKEDEEVT